MFIITAKFSKRKLFFGIAVTAALLLTAGAAAHLAGDVAAMGNRADSEANDAAQQTVSTLALTDEERTAYLKACGWEVDAASCTVRALMPLGIALGISPYMLIALFPAVNGYFFIPNYPTVVAAINFDRTGTTKIGKYVLNHSFMMPGLVSTVVDIVLGLLFIQIF